MRAFTATRVVLLVVAVVIGLGLVVAGVVPAASATIAVGAMTLLTVGVLVRLVLDDGHGPAEGPVPFAPHGGGG